ncbi:MAG: indole-3-glycerol-phosphate synthase [Candidatus Freyarchaeota archaeon]|nr:indole-3-glycerol-phosphate synthase [Candidatus Jordarchaeia archaeon]
MRDFLDVLADDAKKTVKEGFYDDVEAAPAVKLSLEGSILSCRRAAIISEVKPASPSMGALHGGRSPATLAREMEEGGAIGISVLTEPKHFQGSMLTLAEVRRAVKVPILMKDIVLSQVQVDAAARAGANAVLLIYSVFERGHSEVKLEDMIEYAHGRGVEVLLEVHTRKEFQSSLNYEADMIGVNNRDLRTLKVDLNVTRKVLAGYIGSRVVVSESGISGPEDVRFLYACGAKAFLVGTSIMKAASVKDKVRELVEAL